MFQLRKYELRESPNCLRPNKIVVTERQSEGLLNRSDKLGTILAEQAKAVSFCFEEHALIREFSVR